MGVRLAIAWYFYALIGKDYLPLTDIQIGFIYPIWESLLCCGMCIGLIVLFREYFNSEGNLGSLLAKSQYASYIFHVPVVLLFQYLALGFDWSPFVKFAVVTLFSVPTTFLVSHWVRKPLGL